MNVKKEAEHYLSEFLAGVDPIKLPFDQFIQDLSIQMKLNVAVVHIKTYISFNNSEVEVCGKC